MVLRIRQVYLLHPICDCCIVRRRLEYRILVHKLELCEIMLNKYKINSITEQNAIEAEKK
jgi:hypothetical protein